MFKIFKSKENKKGNVIKFEDIPVSYGGQAQNVNENGYLQSEPVYEQDNMQYQPEGQYVDDFQADVMFQDENSDGKKKMSRRKKIFIASACLVLAVFVAIGAFALNFFYVKKTYVYVSSYSNLKEPVQVETTGGTSVKFENNTKIEMEFKAKYTIIGRVVDKQFYYPKDVWSKISQYDVGMVWGVLSDHKYDEYITFRSTTRRSLSYQYEQKLVNLLGSAEIFTSCLSNTHMIHANETVLKCLRNVKRDQYIKVEGYLVYCTYYSNDTAGGTWNSSLIRTDHGDGACEVMYVTKISWVKLSKK